MRSLELKNISFSFSSDKLLLDNISLDLRQNESIVIAGANGSGKSTLLQLIAGLLLPQSGSVQLVENGKQIDHHRCVALVMQNPDHQMIAATVEDEIALALELRGIPRVSIQDQIDKMFDLFDLHDIKSREPEALSGGQKQRVALASIFAASPDFLLLDEADAMLDAPGRNEFQTAVHAIRNHCGIIFTCADPDRLPHANRYYWLDNGHLLEASPETILEFSTASVE